MIGPLDLLIGLILVLFVPLGVWRGLLREALTTGGILLAAVVAGDWAPVWGPALTAQTGLTRPLALFLVAISLFLGVVLVIGYGSALLLPARAPGRWGRAAGGPLGLVNAALIVGYTLRFLQIHLYGNAPDSAIAQSSAAWFLANLVAVVFLLPVLVLTPAIIVAAGVRLVRRRRGYAAVGAAATTAVLPALADTAATRPIQRPAGVADTGSPPSPLQVPRPPDEPLLPASHPQVAALAGRP